MSPFPSIKSKVLILFFLFLFFFLYNFQPCPRVYLLIKIIKKKLDGPTDERTYVEFLLLNRNHCFFSHILPYEPRTYGRLLSRAAIIFDRFISSIIAVLGSFIRIFFFFFQSSCSALPFLYAARTYSHKWRNRRWADFGVFHLQSVGRPSWFTHGRAFIGLFFLSSSPILVTSS